MMFVSTCTTMYHHNFSPLPLLPNLNFSALPDMNISNYLSIKRYIKIFVQGDQLNNLKALPYKHEMAYVLRYTENIIS